jgi:DNA-binding response OmpR family regulator
MRRALVVDGDSGDRSFAASALEFAGMHVAEVADAPAALDLLAREAFDAAVCELDLRSMSGIALVREIRADHDLPVVVVSRCADPMFAVIALEAGADDYCTKPVTERELVLRVQRAIARQVAEPVPPVVPVVIAAGDGLVIEPGARIVAVDGVEMDLTAKEFDLLLALASAPGQVFTRGELLELVWEAKPDWQSVDTVTEHIYRLRQKLDGHGVAPNRIQTVRGAGYRFAREASTVADRPAAPAVVRQLAG